MLFLATTARVNDAYIQITRDGNCSTLTKEAKRSDVYYKNDKRVTHGHSWRYVPMTCKRGPVHTSAGEFHSKNTRNVFHQHCGGEFKNLEGLRHGILSFIRLLSLKHIH